MNDFVPATPFLQFPDSIKSPMLDLSALFGRFIHYRMGLDQEVFPKESYAPVPFKELTVRWGGMMGGILVLRASLLQLTQWFHNPQTQHLEYKDETVLFNEMAVSFGIYLIQCTGLEDWENIGPVLARPSQTSNWPQRVPDAACRFGLGPQPVEIRLWLSMKEKTFPT